jgi:hypothetical protein
LELDGPVEVTDGVIIVAFITAIDNPSVDVCLGKVGLELNGLGVIADGMVRVTLEVVGSPSVKI